MKQFQNLINKNFSFSRSSFLFVQEKDEIDPLLVVSNGTTYSLFDKDMKLLFPDIRSFTFREMNRIMVKKGKPGHLSGYLFEQIEARSPFNLLNYCCDVEYFIQSYNGIFLGVLPATEDKEGITAKINDETFIPAVLFNSHGPNISNYMKTKGKLNVWLGDDFERDVLKDDVVNYPWVIYFNGNDDCSYYCRFRTFAEAVMAWENMKAKNRIADEIDHVKGLSLRELFELQTMDNLFYFYCN